MKAFPQHLRRSWVHPDPLIEAQRILALAVNLYRPRAVFGLYSGGHDSAVSTHLAARLPGFTAAASIDTTIGLPQTIAHRRAVCVRMGWAQVELRPPITYLEFCAKFGMPGPGAHALVYSWLKERCVRQLVREAKRRPSDRVMLVTGVRSQESERRMGHVEAIQRLGAQVWVAPCINWSREQREVYRVDHALPANPVHAALGMSGECLCGAFARDGELEKIARVSPETAEHIAECQRAAAVNARPCRWGKKPERARMLCTQCERKGPEAA